MAGIGGFALIVTESQTKETTTVIVPRGSSVVSIAELLAEKGLISSPILFRIASRFIALNNLKAGEYEVEAGQSIADIVLMMYAGDTIVRQLTLVEGTTSASIAASLRNDITLTGTLEITPQEGSLLPETYNYSFGDSRTDIVNRMQRDMSRFLDEAWKGRDQDIPLKSITDAVILASIIEKETGKADERSRVAGVFYNRLRIPMRLQSDPTVVYAIERERGSLGRLLVHDDLAFASPYNTYASDGLPPAPICNPGKASILAALHPEKHNFLYFMADGAGGHRFAASLEDHNRNINIYRGLTPTPAPATAAPVAAPTPAAAVVPAASPAAPPQSADTATEQGAGGSGKQN